MNLVLPWFITLPTGADAKDCDEYSVCLSVREDISRTACVILYQIFVQIFMAVARSSSGIVAIHYVLQFCGSHHVVFYNGPYSGMNFATKD